MHTAAPACPDFAGPDPASAAPFAPSPIGGDGFPVVSTPTRWDLWWSKCLNRPRYRRLKDERNQARQIKVWIDYVREGKFQMQHPTGPGPHVFKHSGNAGDIIYSLPAIRALAGPVGADLRFKLNVPLRDKTLVNHPLGGVMLNEKMLAMLAPLLQRQPYIRSVEAYQNGRIDVDLDVFRDSPLMLDRLGISRWYFYFTGVAPDLTQPWLEVEPDLRFSESIVLARSHRYRNPTLNYRFLRRYPQVTFVGIEAEYLDMRRELPSLQWEPVEDFVQLAAIIAGSRLFIGNQSMPFALAEALKVPRILECNPFTPNVVPTGANGYDVLFQPQFEQLVARLATPSLAYA